MTPSTRRTLAAAAWIAPAAALTLVLAALGPARSGSRGAPSLPVRLGGWEGEDAPLAPRTLDLLGPGGGVLNRRYRKEGGRGEGKILVCVVLARGAARGIHPPEVCYRGWGYEITARATVRVPGERGGGGFSANLLELDRDGRRRLALFWYQRGRAVGRSFLLGQIRAVLAPVAGGARDWALVRLSTALPAGAAGREGALRNLVDLAARVHGALGRGRGDAGDAPPGDRG